MQLAERGRSARSHELVITGNVARQRHRVERVRQRTAQLQCGDIYRLIPTPNGSLTGFVLPRASHTRYRADSGVVAYAVERGQGQAPSYRENASQMLPGPGCTQPSHR